MRIEVQGDHYSGSDVNGEQALKGANLSFLSISLCLSFVILVVACFYCFKYPRSRKKSFAEDEEDSTKSSTSIEQKSNGIPNTTSGMPESRTRKISHWTKISSFFPGTSASGELDYRLSNQTPVTEKSPIGEMKTTYVQPASRDAKYRTQNSVPVPPTKQRSFIPESFKLPFDPWLISEDNSSPPQGADYLGRLEFSVMYAFDSQTLIVKILKANDLPAMDLSGFSDPFVKCCLLPDRKRKLETKIRRKTLNPSWNETLLFEGLSYDKIQQRVLYMQIMDWDRFSRNDPIGEVCIPLHQLDLTDNQPQCEYLTPCTASNKRGELLISLCYRPVEGKIDVEIKTARNLKPMDIGGTSDPYVKIWLLIRGKRVDKQKTAIIKSNLNPNFNEKFVFDSPMDKLREIQLEISVMDRDKIGRNETIGKIYLGTKSNGLEKRHWKEMLTKIRQPVEQWHILKV